MTTHSHTFTHNYEQTIFVHFIEQVNTPMLVSPIMMIPKFHTPKELQELYLDQFGDFSIRNGPLVTNTEREKTRVEVEKTDYGERSTLVAAPILFQTKGTKTAACPYNYSSVFVQQMHETAMADKCEESIYACEDKVSMVESMSTCTSQGSQTEMYFGLMPSDFAGKTGYADFLASIADNPFVFRQLQNVATAGGKGILSLCAPMPMMPSSMLAMTTYSIINTELIS